MTQQTRPVTQSSRSPRDRAPRHPDRLGWRQEGMDLLRGIAAGAIVGMPLLYTMEMWWRGMTVRESHLLLLLAAMLAVNFVFCYFSGFREEYSAFEAASESVTSVALGMLFSLAVLVLVGEIRFDVAAAETLGKVVIAAFPVSLGVSFANAHLRNKSRTGDERGERGVRGARGGNRGAGEDGPRLPPLSRQLRQDLKDLGVTVSGALVFSFNLAPTEEIVMIATRIPAWQHLLIMAASLLLCHTIIFAAGFREHEVHVPSPFQHPWAETLMAYAVSLLVAIGLLYLVGVPEATSGTVLAAKCAVTLGLPAVVGASAGRLVL